MNKRFESSPVDQARIEGNIPPETLEAIRGLYYYLDTNDVDRLYEAIHEDWEDMTLPEGRPPGPEGLIEGVNGFHTAMSDLKVTMHQVTGGDKLVAIRMTVSGTQDGPLLDIPPQNQPFSFDGYAFHEVVDGRIKRSWHQESFGTSLAAYREKFLK